MQKNSYALDRTTLTLQGHFPRRYGAPVAIVPYYLNWGFYVIRRNCLPPPPPMGAGLAQGGRMIVRDLSDLNGLFTQVFFRIGLFGLIIVISFESEYIIAFLLRLVKVNTIFKNSHPLRESLCCLNGASLWGEVFFWFYCKTLKWWIRNKMMILIITNRPAFGRTLAIAG